ncbi:MAG TPA: META domain-containing protein [Sphingomicrobium sp.]|nr:META domain-containing protein [Sphingomicrobium sp.]
MLGRLAAAALPLVAGCTSIHTDQRTFQGTSWYVSALSGQATGPAHAYYMLFHQGRVSGRFGCNYFNGRYSPAGEIMAITQVAATRMACDGPAAMHERIGFATLSEPMRMTWAGDRLTLGNARGWITLDRPEKAPAPPAISIVGRWKVVSINGIPPPSRAVIAFTESSYDANFGCNDMQGGYRLEGSYFRIEGSRMTERGCELIPPTAISLHDYEDLGRDVLWRAWALVTPLEAGRLRLENSLGTIVLERLP